MVSSGSLPRFFAAAILKVADEPVVVIAGARNFPPRRIISGVVWGVWGRGGVEPTTEPGVVPAFGGAVGAPAIFVDSVFSWAALGAGSDLFAVGDSFIRVASATIFAGSSTLPST